MWVREDERRVKKDDIKYVLLRCLKTIKLRMECLSKNQLNINEEAER